MITGARRKSLSLTGLMYAKVNALQAVRHSGNLSKPVILWATDSGSVEVYFETSKRAGKGSETDYREDSVSGAGGGCGAHHTASYKLPHRDKKGLRSEGRPVYGYSAPAKSGAGIGLPVMLSAIHDAPSVFFCVVSSVHPFFCDTGIIRAARKIMVGCVGASSEAPVSDNAGKTNSAQSTTRKIGLFGGGYKNQLSEAAAMATTPNQNPQFIWIIAAVRRDCPTITAKIHHIISESEQEARRTLTRDHVCFFAGRIRLEVAA